ncbi:MAG TPA: hypothetical protein VHP36_08045 [Chitinispirillaceae bacterium]|nr:hypothetical protein [Chitinispirillaceae bacterium]
MLFFEPVFHFHRFFSTQKTIPVLVDASQSMSLFGPESTVIPFLKRLQQINETIDSKRKKYHIFLFGDSLRDLSKLEDLKFMDKTSQFPTDCSKYLNDSELVIISDANWTNTFPVDFFADKNIQYLHMSDFENAPFLRILHSEITSTPADSIATLQVAIDGRIEESKPVNLKIMENQKIINRFSINESAGYFKRNLEIKLPSTSPGIHLYRLNAFISDSLHTNDYMIRYVAPQNFLYDLQSTSPSLDRRFLALSISKHPEFKKTTKQTS